MSTRRILKRAIQSAAPAAAIVKPLAIRHEYVVSLRASGKRGDELIVTSDPLETDFWARDIRVVAGVPEKEIDVLHGAARVVRLAIDGQQTHDFGRGLDVSLFDISTPLWFFATSIANRTDNLLVKQGSRFTAIVKFKRKCTWVGVLHGFVLEERAAPAKRPSRRKIRG